MNIKTIFYFVLLFVSSSQCFAAKDMAVRYPSGTPMEVYTPNNPPPGGGGTNYWSLNGVSINTTYPVGIGSTSPRGKLDVNGEIYGSGTNLTGVLHSYTETSTLDNVLSRGNTSTNSMSVGTATVSSGNLLVSVGNIGIGTAIPMSVLDVEKGDVNLFKSTSYAGGVDGNNLFIYRGSTFYKMFVDQYGEAIINTNSGSGLILQSSGTNTVTVNSTVTSGSEVAGLKILSTNNQANSSNGGVGAVRATGTNSGTGVSTPLRGLEGTADFTGTGTQTNAQGVYGIVDINHSGQTLTNAYSVYGDAPTTMAGTITNAYAGGFNGRVWIGGNVGIGSASPAQKLDVNGTCQVTGFKMPTGASSGYVLTSNNVGVGTWMPASGGGGGTWGSITGTLSSQTDLQAALDSKLASAISHTYAEIKAMADGGTLKPQQWYLMTDFRTRNVLYYDFSTGVPEYHEADVEPLLVQAMDVSNLYPTAYSSTYPQDILQYILTDTFRDDHYSNVIGDKGRITKRVDTVLHVSVPEDFRGIVNRRWADADGNYICYREKSSDTWFPSTPPDLGDYEDSPLFSSTYHDVNIEAIVNNEKSLNCIFGSQAYLISAKSMGKSTFRGSFYQANLADGFYKNVLMHGGLEIHTYGDFSSNFMQGNLAVLEIARAFQSNTQASTSTIQVTTIGKNCVANNFNASIYNSTFGDSFQNKTLTSDIDGKIVLSSTDTVEEPSISIGINTLSGGYGNNAIGVGNANLNGYNTAVIGLGNTLNDGEGFYGGNYNSSTNGVSNAVVGRGNVLTNSEFSSVLGLVNTINAGYAAVLGYNNTANEDNAILVGQGNTGNSSGAALGFGNTVNTDKSGAFGTDITINDARRNAFQNCLMGYQRNRTVRDAGFDGYYYMGDDEYQANAGGHTITPSTTYQTIDATVFRVLDYLKFTIVDGDGNDLSDIITTQITNIDTGTGELTLKDELPSITPASNYVKLYVTHVPWMFFNSAVNMDGDTISEFSDKNIKPKLYLDPIDETIKSYTDVEIVDSTKGIIMTDTVTGTRYRLQMTDGVLTPTAL